MRSAVRRGLNLRRRKRGEGSDHEADPIVRALSTRPKLQVHGSGELTWWLLANDLVDEMNLLIVPWSSARVRDCPPTPART